jgi:hypothetical protein
VPVGKCDAIEIVRDRIEQSPGKSIARGQNRARIADHHIITVAVAIARRLLVVGEGTSAKFDPSIESRSPRHYQP